HDFAQAASTLAAAGYGDRSASPRARADGSQLPEIVVTGTAPRDLAERAWELLGAANEPPRLFVAGGPVRLETDDEQLPIVRPLDSKRIVYELSYIAEWKRRTERGLTPIAPPASVATQMLATPEMPLPVLARIVEAPVFARDGTLQIDAGYHPASRTLYVPASGFTIPPVPERPTARELEE